MKTVLILILLVVTQTASGDLLLETDQLELRFNDRGELMEVMACWPDCLDPEGLRGRFDNETAIVKLPDSPAIMQPQQFREPGGQRLLFRTEQGTEVEWRIPDSGYLIELRGTELGGLSLESGPAMQPRPAAGFGRWLEQLRSLEFESQQQSWAGFRNRYWALMAAQGDGEWDVFEDELSDTIRLKSDGEPEFIMLYLGPVEPNELKAASPALQQVMYANLWDWLRWMCFGLFHLLAWIKSFVPSWGLAIMLLSVSVHVLMLPLSRLAERLQQQVNRTEARLAPKLREIKMTSKGEEQAERTLALYREEGIHPLYSLKSLLGVAIVIPVFIAAFDMLAENIHLYQISFVWMDDLSRPDAIFTLPFHLPFFGEELNGLPFVMTALSLWASALHRPPALDADSRRRQVRNMIVLALLFFLLFYTFPAGMVLYWTTNNLISVIKSVLGPPYNDRNFKEEPHGSR